MKWFVPSMVIAIIALITVVSTAQAASGWRTIAVGQGEEKGSYVFDYFTMETRALNVNALQIKSTSTVMPNLDVRVECNRGETNASRTLKKKLTSGVRMLALPVPLPGGICSARIMVDYDQAGRVSLELQVR